MATLAGIIKQLSGSAVARDAQGNERKLSVGDELMIGEKVITLSIDSKVVIATANGSEITILGNDELALDQSLIGAGSDSNVVADISDLQKALLEGDSIENLEATAAGEGGVVGGGSLGSVDFVSS